MIDRDKFYFRTFCVLFWVAAAFGFVSQEILPFLEEYTRTALLLVDIGFVLLGIYTVKGRNVKVLIAIFLVLSFYSTIFLNHLSLVYYINGIREFIGIILGFTIIRYFFQSKQASYFIESIDKQLLIFLWMQVFCITEQFIRYGANDYVGGSLGNGYSGIISIMIISISFYFVTKNWDNNNYLRSLWNNRMYILLMFPILLNETKASFVLVVLYFLLLYRYELKSVGKILISVPLFIGFILGMYFVYRAVTPDSEEVASTDYISAYLEGDADIELAMDFAEVVQEEGVEINEGFGIDLPRFLKIGIMPEIVSESGGGVIFGAGAGTFKGGETLELTPFSKENQWFLIGTVPMLMFLFVSMGTIGVIWYILWMLNAISFRKRASKMALQRKIFLATLIVFTLFYNDCFRYIFYPSVFYFFCCASSIVVPNTELKENE